MPKSKLSTMSIADLRQEIESRQKLLPRLIAQRDALNRDIAALQGLAAPQARKPARPQAATKRTPRRRRANNKVRLSDALAGFLKGKAEVTIGEAVAGVLADGYKTTAGNFHHLVNKTLLADKRFKNVARGVFTLKA